MTSEPTIAIADHPEARRYEARVDGELAAIAEYRNRRGVRTFTHTLVYAQFEGRGLGSRLAKAALDDTRAKGLSIVPLCPFIAAYIRSHPEYADLVRAPDRA
jgi:predicted GNAT family acetyltransferase